MWNAIYLAGALLVTDVQWKYEGPTAEEQYDRSVGSCSAHHIRNAGKAVQYCSSCCSRRADGWAGDYRPRGWWDRCMKACMR